MSRPVAAGGLAACGPALGAAGQPGHQRVDQYALGGVGHARAGGVGVVIGVAGLGDLLAGAGKGITQ